MSFTLYITENFYSSKYYLSSTITFFLFICTMKFFMDSLFHKMGFAHEDYNIFGNFPKTKNQTQFFLKLITLTIGTLIVGIFSFTKFQHFYNYVVFYTCLTQIMNLVSIFLQYEVPTIFQPFKHCVMITCGFMNFIILNFHNPEKFSIKYKNKIDSFYLVGDIYTFICFTFLYDYLFTQSNNISNLFYERTLDNEKINSQISNIMKDYREMVKEFNEEDLLWLLAFSIGMLFQYVGIISGKYLVFYFSFYYFKIIFSIFGRIYNVKYLRVVFCIES